jgi:hypothetical protein
MTAISLRRASIMGAIGKASSGDTIYVAAGTYTRPGGTAVVEIDRSLTLKGGYDDTFSTQSGISTVDGQETRRGVALIGGITVSIDHFTIQNGEYYSGCAGIEMSDAGQALTVSDSLIQDNNSGFLGSYPDEGGGLCTMGTATLIDTQVVGNSAPTWGSTSGTGGGIYNTGTLTLTNSVVRGNSAIDGGGIYNTGTLLVDGSLVATIERRLHYGGSTGFECDDAARWSTRASRERGGERAGIFGAVVASNSTISATAVAHG